VLRLLFLVVALVGLSWFQFWQPSSAAALARRTVDLADARPARSVLILGNSRTYFNDMPSMLRKIADSAGSPTKFQIESHSRPAYTMADHWSDRRTTRLLGETWDEIILQGESAAQSSLEQSASFKGYGSKLARLTKLHSGRPILLVNWPYDPSIFADYEPYDRSEHLDFLHNVHADLAGRAHLDLANVASLWEDVRLSQPKIKLTTDGNHPTVAGSYLYALAIYRYLSNGSVSQVSYVPEGLDAEDAAVLRQAVDAHLLPT
jgi:hypothetical protein